MTGSDVPNIKDQRGVSFLLSPYFGALGLDFLVRGDTHPCPYRPNLEACEQVFRTETFPPELYHDFMDIGFRRSGKYFYRPVCAECNECRPIRTLLSEYRPNKPHRRILNKNSDVAVSIGSPKFTLEKYRLYRYYLESRHGSGFADSPSAVKRSMYSSPVQTLEFEYRLQGRLIAAGLVDLCSRSLSSVYVFYDPDLSRRSLGTFSALQELSFARDRGIPYYYLGFFVADCKAMNYKAHYRPYETLSESFDWVGRPGS